MKAIIWTQNLCAYCDMAKKELKLRGYEIEERNIEGKTWSKKDLLKVTPSAKKVPQVFIFNNHIGGYNDLMRYFEETTSNYGH